MAAEPSAVRDCFRRYFDNRTVPKKVLRQTLQQITSWDSSTADEFLSSLDAVGDGDLNVDELLRSLFGDALQSKQNRVAIYGGAFDPVTNAHLTMAAQIVQSNCADEVWLVPSGPRPDKPKLKTPAVDRYCMCQVAVNTVFTQDFPVKVSDEECLLDEALATYDLLCKLREKHPGWNFSFVIGSDWLQPGTNMAEWDSKNLDWKPGDPEDQQRIVTGHKMLTEFDFLVVKRPGYDVDSTPDDPTGLMKFGPRMSWLKMPEGMTFIEGNLSSSEIRKRTQAEDRVQEAAQNLKTRVMSHLEALRPIEGLVPRAVLSYIRRHSFYVSPSAALPASRKRVAIYGGGFDPVTNSHLTCAAEIIHSQCVDAAWLVPCGPRPDKPRLKTPPIDRYCMCKIAVNFSFSVDFPIMVSDIECFSKEAFATYDLLCSLKDKHPDTDFSFVIGSDWLQPGANMAEWESKNWDWKPGDPEENKTIVTGDKMLQEFDFLVIHRPGYDVARTPDDPTGLKQFGPRLSWLVMPEGMTFIEGNLSSTEIRKRLTITSKSSQASLDRLDDDHDAVLTREEFVEFQEGHHDRANWGLNGLTPPGVISYMHRRSLYQSV
eukprot:TRINITY_DN13303_c0_g1_i1.p1 TRINITY_DN13303_c0_g1~~TRINITY_DN13303_c0_g1_i1.p1  ORF type:complete len:600 (-),score=84.57 TRINITY_DN13303_c0_g1_i1:41-1840(-)